MVNGGGAFVGGALDTRDESEFELMRWYIEDSLLRLGLVAKPADYRWSRANAGSKAVVAGFQPG